MAHKICITEPLIHDVIDWLRNQEEVDLYVGERGEFDRPEALSRAAATYDAILTMLSNPVDRTVFESGAEGALKVVANYAVGYDNIDLQAAREFNIPVTNTPGVLSDATADLTWALILSVARKICGAQAYLQAGKFDGWEPKGFLGLEMNGSTLGIIGMGRIGSAVARRARGFGMNVIYHNRNRLDSELEEDLDASYVHDIYNLATRSDVVSLHCPLTDQTRHLVDQQFLERMPEHALLINTARGPVVNEVELAFALQKGTIAGAGIDVYEQEPEVHPELANAPNTVLLPHIGSATTATRRKMGMMAARGIMHVLNGNDPKSLDNLIRA